MMPQTILDQIIFQLTPTRTRCELFAVAGDVTEKLTSGLLKPFLEHLQTAEEQLAKGGYSIKLQPPSQSKASWFTKGTAERFVRFVSSPEVIERVNTIETELIQLEETIRMQTLTSARVDDELVADSSPISILGEKTLSSSENSRVLKKMRHDSIDSNDSGVGRNSKKQLLKALDGRRSVLMKEQGMAFARSAAAGFELVHLLELVMFSDCFGAARLREACFNFVALCRKRQIAGFCVGDVESLDQDLTWALSNTTCVSILNSMKEISPSERKRELDSDALVRASELGVHESQKLHSGSESFELSSGKTGYQPELLSVPLKFRPSSAFCEWSNSTDPYQGWPALYTTRNYPYATFQGYQYGFSPGSQESFTTFPGMSPTDATGICQDHPMGALSQPLSETPQSLQRASSQEMTALPSLRKLQVGHRGAQTRGRMSAKDFNGEELRGHGYEKDSSDLTDSSFERSDTLRVASLVGQEESASHVEVRSDLGQGLVDAAKFCWNKRSGRELPDLRSQGSRGGSDLSDLSSSDASIAAKQNKERTRLDQHIDGVQGSERTVIGDDFSSDFKQYHEGSFGSKLKKRLDFQEPEAQQKSGALDDSFYVHPRSGNSRSGNYEQRTVQMSDPVVLANQIFDRMSKQALKMNSKQSLKVSSLLSKQDPDDLLMMPKQRKRASTRNFSDVMNIDIELLKSTDHANLRTSQKGLTNTEPSQERVKNFLDQYNEKREAKLRGELSSTKRAEREGKLKAMRRDLESRKSEMDRARRPEKAASRTEAQLRADKLRSYKADLQKVKKEKEDEARQRLEELKAQRQERIAARSHSAVRSNPNLPSLRGQLNSKLPASFSMPGTVGRQSSLQKSRTSLPVSQAVSYSASRPRTARSQEFSSKETPSSSSRSLSKPAVNQVRSTASSVPRQTKAGIGSRLSTSTQSFKAPQPTKPATSARSTSVPSALFEGREYQRSRTTFPRKSEQSSITSKEPGFRSRLPGLRGQTVKAGKEMKQDGKNFLKKGSGIGSSGRSVSRPKSASPVKARALDKGPLFCASSHVNRVTTSRLDMKEATVSEGRDGMRASRPIVKKTSASTSPGLRRVRDETKCMTLSQSKSKEAGDLVQSDINHSWPRSSHDRDMAGPSTSSSLQTMPSRVLEKNNNRPSEAAVNSHQKLPADSTMSDPVLCNRSCTTNVDSSSNKQSIIFNTIFPIKNVYPESTICTGSVSSGPHFKESTSYLSSTLQIPCKQQSNGFEEANSQDEFSTCM